MDSLGGQLDLSMAYHLQMGDQSKRMIPTLEYMLRACILKDQQKRCVDKHKRLHNLKLATWRSLRCH